MPKRFEACVKAVKKSSPKVNPYAVCKANKAGKLKYKLVDKKGKIVSRHFTKKHAEQARLMSGRNLYLRKL